MEINFRQIREAGKAEAIRHAQAGADAAIDRISKELENQASHGGSLVGEFFRDPATGLPWDSAVVAEIAHRINDAEDPDCKGCAIVERDGKGDLALYVGPSEAEVKPCVERHHIQSVDDYDGDGIKG